MVATINASVSSSGIVSTADGSGILKVQSNGVATNALAWVSFIGSSATIRSSYNVSSVTRVSSGQYTINFTNTLSDANYSAVISASALNGTYPYAVPSMFSNYSGVVAPTTSSFSVSAVFSNGGASWTGGDFPYANVAVFGN